MQVLISPKSENASVWIEIYAAKQRTQINIWNFVKIVWDPTYFWGNFTLNLLNAALDIQKTTIFFIWTQNTLVFFPSVQATVQLFKYRMVTLNPINSNIRPIHSFLLMEQFLEEWQLSKKLLQFVMETWHLFTNHPWFNACEKSLQLMTNLLSLVLLVYWGNINLLGKWESHASKGNISYEQHKICDQICDQLLVPLQRTEPRVLFSSPHALLRFPGLQNNSSASTSPNQEM